MGKLLLLLSQRSGSCTRNPREQLSPLEGRAGTAQSRRSLGITVRFQEFCNIANIYSCYSLFQPQTPPAWGRFSNSQTAPERAQRGVSVPVLSHLQSQITPWLQRPGSAPTPFTTPRLGFPFIPLLPAPPQQALYI